MRRETEEPGKGSREDILTAPPKHDQVQHTDRNENKSQVEDHFQEAARFK